mmetsp:Transcript_115636/g.373602  ORF Transcript_115636/g.373602 Transcript_115636/m.373602 type:complete len:206 (+) Transcript_115636:3-620(+)
MLLPHLPMGGHQRAVGCHGCRHGWRCRPGVPTPRAAGVRPAHRGRSPTSSWSHHCHRPRAQAELPRFPSARARRATGARWRNGCWVRGCRCRAELAGLGAHGTWCSCCPGGCWPRGSWAGTRSLLGSTPAVPVRRPWPAAHRATLPRLGLPRPALPARRRPWPGPGPGRASSWPRWCGCAWPAAASPCRRAEPRPSVGDPARSGR